MRNRPLLIAAAAAGLGPAFRVVASAHIAAAGADATTNQMTPPSGKTGGDFEAGWLSDDVNPLPAVSWGGADRFTEVELCVEATDAAVLGETYEWRVTLAGVPLDSYAVTPEWTIGASGPVRLPAPVQVRQAVQRAATH